MAPTTASWARRTASRCRTRWPRTAPTSPTCRCSPAARATPDGKKGDANAAVIAALVEAGALLAARHARPQLSAFLALQGAADLPQHAAVVHPHGRAERAARRRRWPRSTRPAASRAQGRNRLRSHDREPARLVRLAPARLGRADRRLRRQGDRRAAARSRGDRAHRRGLRGTRAPMPGSRARPARFLGNDYDPADYEQVDRHPRRLVRFRLDPRLRAGAAARARTGRPRSISKAPTSIAAGSIPRCWRAAARAAARPTTRC